MSYKKKLFKFDLLKFRGHLLDFTVTITLRIIDEILFNQLENDIAFFTLPMNQNTFNGQIVKGVADNALNVRVYSLFVQLQLQNTKDFPETIYLKVTHDGDSEFR